MKQPWNIIEKSKFAIKPKTWKPDIRKIKTGKPDSGKPEKPETGKLKKPGNALFYNFSPFMSNWVKEIIYEQNEFNLDQCATYRINVISKDVLN